MDSREECVLAAPRVAQQSRMAPLSSRPCEVERLVQTDSEHHAPMHRVRSTSPADAGATWKAILAQACLALQQWILSAAMPAQRE
ncbi:hypothetical protein HBI56_183120 [Parastagonospora nodorum]|nr:hypothetical protein HBH56_191600 [Parastagonospora nodorum]KAH3937745.1 hypothetical protein HBH54_010400 [Parastagonospora nodorum]KAH3966564.1 hypothetical protein HBH52_199360 [Parastagonospora nodorum]KAH3994181.1 hypothetical protein HBI10_189160 [Parastagonospora nodorum]KAH4013563.1 hypothetical protein HBI13_177990 [Parastagonospora nodorum]